ncbi:MAG TPA: DNA/RNA non-specific endonuclease [Opitutus sp.]|nr:DNA/RNA non-specific endonuclease [Opitutus sp.]
MARRSKRSRRSSSFAPFFLWLNLILAVAIGGWYLVQPTERQADVRRLVANTFERKKQISPLDLARDLWELYYRDAAAGRIATGDKSLLYGGVPLDRSADANGALRILKNRGYVVGYSDAHGNPAWVAYRVADLENIPATPPRPEKFEVDRRTTARVSPDAYTNSGYDRGHLAPNYAIAIHYGADAQAETFLMSNITPQLHALNAGLWKELEMKIATSYPARYAEVWAIVGPVFGANPPRLPGGVLVPEAFFAILVDEHEGKLRTFALLIPQDAAPSNDVARFLTTIDEIERRTQLDFLPELDDVSENEIERVRAARVW